MSIGFTQRDVDPLGRGNATQQVGRVVNGHAVCDEFGDPDHDCTDPVYGTHVVNIPKSDDEQRSDLRKRDENISKSGNL